MPHIYIPLFIKFVKHLISSDVYTIWLTSDLFLQVRLLCGNGSKQSDNNLRMGSSQSVFTEQELNDYQVST